LFIYADNMDYQKKNYLLGNIFHFLTVIVLCVTFVPTHWFYQHVCDVAPLRMHQHCNRGAHLHLVGHAQSQRFDTAVRTEAENPHRRL
jgi:hypothetical protein